MGKNAHLNSTMKGMGAGKPFWKIWKRPCMRETLIFSLRTQAY